MAAPVRVQTTPLSRGSGTSLNATFTTAPTVGNGIVVVVCEWGANAGLTTVADNFGHVYTTAVSLWNGAFSRASIYVCAQVTATGSPFTVTALGANDYRNIIAIEVSGVGSGLTLDQSASAAGTGTTVNTGVTSALTAADVFVVAAEALDGPSGVMTVESVSPAWFEEYEDTSFTASPSEVDSRSLTGVLGTTQQCNWTNSGGGAHVAALAAFKAGAAASTTPTRLSQLPIEVLRGSQPAPSLRVSQLPIEVLRGSQPAPSLRLSQLPIEILRSPGTAEAATAIRLSQLPIEVLRAAPVVVPPTPVRLSQLPIELLLQLPPVPLSALTITQVVVETLDVVPASPLAATQLVVETLDVVPNSPVSATQVVAELVGANPNDARVTQLLCEVIVITYEPPACIAGSASFPIDPDD